MTTIEDLPFDVLSNILSKLDDDSETLVNICIASSKWEHLVRDRLAYSITLDSDDSIEVLRSTSRPSCVWIIDKNDTKEIVYGAAIKELIFYGTTTLKHFNIMAQVLTKLATLEVGWSNLEMCGTPQAWTSFPQLKRLILGGPGSSTRVKSKDYSRSEILNNLSGLMGILSNTKLPKLETLVISAIFHESRSNILVNSVLTFLETHQETLTGLSVVLNRAKHVQIASQGDENGKNLFRDWECVPEFSKRLSALKLCPKHLFYHYTDPDHNYGNMVKVIQRISGNGGKPTNPTSEVVTTVTLGSDFIDFPTGLIEKNFKTLTVLGLRIRRNGQIDCKVFQTCVQLKKLLLTAPPKTMEEYDTPNYHDQAAQPELTNIANLPQSLKFIQIVNFYIGTEDSKSFGTMLPLLKYLNVQGIGEKEELGLTLDTFFQLLQRGLYEVSVYRGFNKAAVKSDQASADPSVVFRTLSLLGMGVLEDKNHVWELAGYNFSKNMTRPVLMPACDRSTLREELFHNTLSPHYVGFAQEDEDYFKIYEGQTD